MVIIWEIMEICKITDNLNNNNKKFLDFNNNKQEEAKKIEYLCYLLMLILKKEKPLELLFMREIVLRNQPLDLQLNMVKKNNYFFFNFYLIKIIIFKFKLLI